MANALPPSLHCPSFTRSNDARQQTIIIKGLCVSAHCDPDRRYSRSTFALAMTPKHPPGPPMDLASMRRQGVRNLIAFCLNESCRHQAVIDVSSYPGDTPVPWFRSKVKCAKCGARNNRIDVRPNWNEAPGSIEDWSGRPTIPTGDR
jgi:hypothetical protein